MPHSVLEIHCIIIITVPGCIAGTDAPVHEEGDDGHDDAEDGEEHLKRGVRFRVKIKSIWSQVETGHMKIW